MSAFRHLSPILIPVVLAGLAPATVNAQRLELPFSLSYSLRSLGTVPGVPARLGGLCFKYDDPDVLLIGGAANSGSGGIYSIRVTRAANGAIVGFQGTATRVHDGTYNDGGLQYGPNNVLFYTRYPRNEIGQFRPGSMAVDKLIALTAVSGWNGSSPGALSFVPPGFPGAGLLKICSYSGGAFHSCSVTPDGNGTFDLVGMQRVATLPGGPEGILYPPPGSPLLTDYARVLVNEYGSGSVAVYDIDQNGDPIVATRVPFVTGLSGAEGATIDPQTGSFLFSTYGGGNQVVVVDGFGTCGSFVNYGAGIPGVGASVPSIRGTGCATFNRAINFQVGNGPPNAAGALNIGFAPTNIPLYGGFVLTLPTVPITHQLDALGTWSTNLSTPNDPNLIGRSVYLQAAYASPAAPFGVTASDGLEMRVRRARTARRGPTGVRVRGQCRRITSSTRSGSAAFAGTSSARSARRPSASRTTRYAPGASA